jgi:hypothetical protein
MTDKPKYLDKPVPVCPHDYKSIFECKRRGGVHGLIALFGECGESCPFYYESEREKISERLKDLEMQREAKMRDVVMIEMRMVKVKEQLKEFDKKWS